MTPEDKKLAREAIVRNRLTVDQVGEIQKECDATGRSFSHVVIERGLLRLEEIRALQGPAPAPEATPAPVPAEARPRPAKAGAPSALYPALIAASLVILVGLLAATLYSMWERSRRDREQAGVAARLAAEADRQARLARLDYERKIVDEREGRARKALEKARAALRRAEAPAPPGERTFDDPLVEATMHYNVYLDVHPDDAAVLVERSRVHALRRTYQRAVDDLERAIALDRSLEPKVRENLEMLRRMLPKK